MTTHLRSPSWNFVRARLINKFTTQTELELVWWYKREDCLKFLPMHYIISWEDRSKFPLRISQSKRSAAYQLLMTQDVNVSSLEGGLGDNDKNILWLLSFCFISLGNYNEHVSFSSLNRIPLFCAIFLLSLTTDYIQALQYFKKHLWLRYVSTMSIKNYFWVNLSCVLPYTQLIQILSQYSAWTIQRRNICMTENPTSLRLYTHEKR